MDDASRRLTTRKGVLLLTDVLGGECVLAVLSVKILDSHLEELDDDRQGSEGFRSNEQGTRRGSGRTLSKGLYSQMNIINKWSGACLRQVPPAKTQAPCRTGPEHYPSHSLFVHPPTTSGNHFLPRQPRRSQCALQVFRQARSWSILDGYDDYVPRALRVSPTQHEVCRNSVGLSQREKAVHRDDTETSRYRESVSCDDGGRGIGTHDSTTLPHALASVSTTLPLPSHRQPPYFSSNSLAMSFTRLSLSPSGMLILARARRA